MDGTFTGANAPSNASSAKETVPSSVTNSSDSSVFDRLTDKKNYTGMYALNAKDGIEKKKEKATRPRRKKDRPKKDREKEREKADPDSYVGIFNRKQALSRVNMPGPPAIKREKKTMTKTGYVKDGFVVDDDEDLSESGKTRESEESAIIDLPTVEQLGAELREIGNVGEDIALNLSLVELDVDGEDGSKTPSGKLPLGDFTESDTESDGNQEDVPTINVALTPGKEAEREALTIRTRDGGVFERVSKSDANRSGPHTPNSGLYRRSKPQVKSKGAARSRMPTGKGMSRRTDAVNGKSKGKRSDTEKEFKENNITRM